MSDLALAMMTPTEALQSIQEIKNGATTLRLQVLDFYEREGWRALGYINFRECAIAELGYENSHVYRLLEAARIERNISPTGENPIAERHIRPLAQLDPDLQPIAWQQAVPHSPA